MRCLYSLACWFFLLGISTAAAEEQQHDYTGTLEVGLVFPRNESTINPSLVMPFVFSYQNTKLVPTLQPYFIYDVYNYSNTSRPILQDSFGHDSINLSANHDPHFEVNYHRHFNTEGKWLLTLISGFFECYEDPDRTYNNTYNIGTSYSRINITFTTKGPSKLVDLVAATDSKNCSSAAGLTIKVQDTVKTPQGDPRSDEMESDICPLQALATLANKCVAVTPSAASSIAAEITTRVCTWPWTVNKTDKPDGIDCGSPKEEESMGVGIVFGGTTCLAFLLGVLAYVM
ncbi:uncharacterized protein B0J16DRAFT_348266 [Fusarium flagelliforme]|uniref:uncharacterized protein n=1 Tax=Fusarium flagelliforme TaxID=2675880 RepID=UPI001E8D0D02|nr:uncharacterized protein B0J16DRAFT_348266 [Fusarium flagelliforme]KAH7174181.1 hypothetical protein B0J16DRAFT_348266 [Fusarium flagelliforme]